MQALDQALERAYKGELFREAEIQQFCVRLKHELANLPNVVDLASPVIVVGDIHGQFYDLLEVFKIGGYPPHSNYLFLGDYVDRGPCCVEVMTLLALLKLKYPSRITLLRGNHETRSITQVYGFFSECQRKFGGPAVWHAFAEVFDFIPLAALVDRVLFCVHGGLSPAISKIDQIRELTRSQEIPPEGAFTDLMWSDPDEALTGFSTSARGAGYTFGKDVVEFFLHKNGVEHIIRAHQLCNEGYQLLFNETFSTVWSAPNYCFRFQNLASVLLIDEHRNREYITFSEAPENEKYQINKLLDPQPENFSI